MYVCVCPCSYILRKWHISHSIVGLSTFKKCDSYIFQDPMDFVSHIQSNNGDYYHKIIMRIIQSLYSVLFAKYTTPIHQRVDSSFHGIHKGTVKLPNYLNNGSIYKTFQVTKKVRINITNILIRI